jgi:hypothetical protein
VEKSYTGKVQIDTCTSVPLYLTKKSHQSLAVGTGATAAAAAVAVAGAVPTDAFALGAPQFPLPSTNLALRWLMSLYTPSLSASRSRQNTGPSSGRSQTEPLDLMSASVLARKMAPATRGTGVSGISPIILREVGGMRGVSGYVLK